MGGTYLSVPLHRQTGVPERSRRLSWSYPGEDNSSSLKAKPIHNQPFESVFRTVTFWYVSGWGNADPDANPDADPHPDADPKPKSSVTFRIQKNLFCLYFLMFNNEI